MPTEPGKTFSLTRAMTTEEGVYGLILVSGIIAATGSVGAPAWKELAFTLLTVIVFWAAHIYAGAVAAHGTASASGEPMSLRSALRAAMRRTRGMLASTLFPALALLLGALGLIGNSASIWLALWVCVATLGIFGYLAYSRKQAPVYMRLIGALATASFGAVIILAKALVTH